MYPDLIRRYAEGKKTSLQDAAQTFLQVIVLKNLSVPEARFIGGTALVLGYKNPRFSEDVDLTQVKDIESLRPGLVRAKTELEGWFGSPVLLHPPKKGLLTWRLVVRLGRAESLNLHVDSQPYKAYTLRPVVIEYTSIPPLVISAVEIDEIMADKMIALAYRRYLGGRDLFDLWYHWLKSDEQEERRPIILDLVRKKLRERRLNLEDFQKRLSARISEKTSLVRARAEWKRYLPADFQQPAVLQDILLRCRKLSEFRLPLEKGGWEGFYK